MKPYLINSVQEAGLVIKQNEPEILEPEICSPKTLKDLQSCLEGVCNEENVGTGYTLFKGTGYKVAGKTGTALVANGNRGYADHIYQSSFAGYFPANDPMYSCIVVIKNKPFAKKYYGAAVAGPVFKEISDKLFALIAAEKDQPAYTISKDSANYLYAGASDDIKKVMKDLNMSYTDSAGKGEWSRLYTVNHSAVLNDQPTNTNRIPDIRGMGLKDAVYLLENMNLKVVARGIGKVKTQSITPGSAFTKNQTIVLELN